MKNILFLSLLSMLMISSCSTNNQNQNEIEPPSGQITVKVDYLHDGGANIPTTWNDEDTNETVRTATFMVEENEFKFDFVGKWYNSTNKEEFQTKKDPVSYIRSNSELLVKKVIIETFQAEMKVYLTNDMSGDEVSGAEVNPAHIEGSAIEYQLNSSTWSFLAFETYKGSNINIYSFTFYF